MRIQNLLTAYGGNFARPTKYSIKINPPHSTSGQIIDVLAKNVSLPDLSNEPIELTYRGQKVNIPGRNTSPRTVDVTFYLDENYNIRKLFEEWLYLEDQLHYIEGGVENFNDKTGEMIIDVYDYNEKNVVASYTFENIFVTNIAATGFSGTDKDSIIELTVTFSYYRYYKNEGFTGGWTW